MSVDCLGELTGCVEDCVEGIIEDRGVIEIIEAVVKHEGKLRRLIKALKKCCAGSSSSSEGYEEPRHYDDPRVKRGDWVLGTPMPAEEKKELEDVRGRKRK
jgi:hypothetical protein